MKELFIQYATYNLWANNLLLSAIEILSEDQQQAEITSSFTGLYKTAMHMLDAESIWWQRLKLKERIHRPSESFNGTFADLRRQIQAQDAEWVEWISASPEHGFQHEFIYITATGERFKQPVFQMLLHLFNHSTYHRGQLVMMLRQLGVEKIPCTDFLAWTRRK